MKRSVIQRKLMLAAAMSFFASCLYPSALADDRSYDWLVTIETEEVKNALNYAGCTLTPLVKSRITYACADGSQPSRYETLWFCRGNAFGLERYAPLSIPAQTTVAIQVIHRSAKPERAELQAAAQSILRIYIDVGMISKTLLDSAVVPDASLGDIITALNKEHFQPQSGLSEEFSPVPPPLFIKDQSGEEAANLCYMPPRSTHW